MSRYFDEAVQSVPEPYKQSLITVFDTADFARRWLTDNKMEMNATFIAMMTSEVLKLVRKAHDDEEFWSLPEKDE